MGRLLSFWPVFSLFLESGRVSAQDGLAVPKLDLRKPQSLLEQIHPLCQPPHKSETEHWTITWQRSEQDSKIPWASKLWLRGKKINISPLPMRFLEADILPVAFPVTLRKKSVLLSLVSARLFWFPKIFSEAWRAAFIHLSPVLLESGSVSWKGALSEQNQSILTMWNGPLLRGRDTSFSQSWIPAPQRLTSASQDIAARVRKDSCVRVMISTLIFILFCNFLPWSMKTHFNPCVCI